MASFVIGEDTVRLEKQRKEMENIEKSRRHYKKDSRYLEDLYTLTYQEDSSMEDDEEEQKTPKTNGFGLGLASLQVHHPSGHSSSPLTRSMSSGPMSLSQLGGPQTEKQFASSTLDTNLHKILARKMAGGQGVSFRSCKLLTKAYYNLLRDPMAPTSSSLQQPVIVRLNSKDDPKLNWQTLLQTEGQQLANIVAGYSALVKSLNEELVTELINKDELNAEQDSMLETISELTDSLL